MNRVCYPVTRVPEYLIGTITVPEGGLYAGNVVIVDETDGNIKNNFTQFLAKEPNVENLQDHVLAIVLSGGNFEEMNDGRKPIGQPDYTKYQYKAGTTAPVLFLESSVLFYISDDCLDMAGRKGEFLYGQPNSYFLNITEEKPIDVLSVAKIIGKHEFRLGGAFGGEFTSGNVCRVLPYPSIHAAVEQALDDAGEILEDINSGSGIGLE